MKSVHAATLVCLIMSTTGCATYKTLDTAGANGPKFFSGSRLDINAINQDRVGLKKFKVAPPPYPWLDLPASFLLDLIVSPATGVMEISDGIID